jgi:hypothetical protein
VTGEKVHRMILALPEVDEYEHGGLPSFRVRGRRFASMLDDEGVNLALGQEGIRAAIAQWPQFCREEHHGRLLVATRLRFAGAPRDVVEELVTDAWASKAPKRLKSREKGTL